MWFPINVEIELIIMFSCSQSSHIEEIKCSNLYVNARPTLVTLDYVMDMSVLASNSDGPTPANMKDIIKEYVSNRILIP